MKFGTWEILIILIALIFFLVMPILALVFYLRNRELKKQVEKLEQEKKELLNKLLKS